MKQVTVRITGTTPFLMHYDKFSDPLHPDTIAHSQLTNKKKKTEEDRLAIARSEFAGGAYWNKDIGYYMPGHMFKGVLVGAAKLNRLGTAVKRAVLVLESEAPLENKAGDVPPEQLFDNINFRDVRSVCVSQSRIMRYRPRFNEWAAQFTVLYDETQLDEAGLETILKNAGSLIGVGDYRVECGGGFGRFTAEVLQ